MALYEFSWGDSMYLLVAGLAGSGKTTLVANYSRWLRENGHNVRVVNLDPGAEIVPYKPDFDIRNLFTVSQIMKKYGLGPNGALLKAGELLLEKSDEVLANPAFKPYDAIVFIDTPGQLEVFMFRVEGRKFVRKLMRRAPTVVVFLVDAQLCNNIGDFISSWALGLFLQIKLDIPVIPIINKIDLVGEEERKLIEAIVYEPETLKEVIVKKLRGLNAALAEDLVKLVADYQQSMRPIMVSALKGDGFEDLFSVVHETFCSCGDLS